MKYILLIIAPFLCYSQTVWDGPMMTFTKQNFAAPTSEDSQDRITDLVWLTRGNNGGQLYNAKTESNSSKSNSPDLSVEYKDAIDVFVYPNPTTGLVRQDIIDSAFGTTSNLGSLTFSTFRGTLGDHQNNLKQTKLGRTWWCTLFRMIFILISNDLIISDFPDSHCNEFMNPYDQSHSFLIVDMLA